MEDKFLQINNLAVNYTSNDEKVYAVNGISLSLNRGQTLGLVGETGAGKTTIAKTILRVLPENATVLSGEILLEGKNLLSIPEKEMLSVRGNRISMIFQDPMTALNPIVNVGDQICEAIRLHENVTEKEAKARTVKMLELVGIPAERYVEYPHQFSGGMKQRVVIAMALACDPELLLADEPTTALDVTIQAQVLEMINDLKKSYNTAMILITHDLGVVAETCDIVAVVYAGEIVEYGTKRQIFKDFRHPYTEGLFNSIPKLNDNSKRLSPINGLPPDPTHLPKGCRFSPRCKYATEECRSGHPELIDVGEGHMTRCRMELLPGEKAFVKETDHGIN